MLTDNEIKRFVKETLGCACPDKVFRYIDCRAGVRCGGVLLDYEIDIGGRLLVFVATVGEAGLSASLIPRLVAEGENKRNRGNFNRFRLVLLASNPTALAQAAFPVFQSLGADEKIHLHVIAKSDFPD